MGFRTVAIARGRDKEALARQLGAHIYLDSDSQDVATELMKLGGAKTILATVTSGKAMSAMIPGLAVRGRLVVIGVGMDPIEVSPLDLIGASRTVTGHAVGASIELAGHLGLQHTDWCAADHRDRPARTRGGGL